MRSAVLRLFLVSLPMLAACGDSTGSERVRAADDPQLPPATIGVLQCSANVTSASVVCEPGTTPSGGGQQNGPRADLRLLGGQGIYVRLASFGLEYNPGTQVFSFYATVQNLSTRIFATDSLIRHDDGVRVFFASEPTVTGGSSVNPVTVLNHNGTAIYTAAGQKYFQYGGKIGGFDQADLGADGLLPTSEVSTGRQWQFSVENTVTSFAFTVYVATHIEPGPLATAAPQITSISPATLVPGETATITGINFDPAFQRNGVNIGGVGTAVTSGGSGSLTVTVPCVASGTVPVTVMKSPDNLTGSPMTGAPYQQPLQGPCG
ncbi:MAG: IPT/TIG domain-containing protein [Thioalkalivibrio sp.]|nr:IPT/TIG domain-containing protein [Thioalkalivibrio sp.]